MATSRLSHLGRHSLQSVTAVDVDLYAGSIALFDFGVYRVILGNRSGNSLHTIAKFKDSFIDSDVFFFSGAFI